MRQLSLQLGPQPCTATALCLEDQAISAPWRRACAPTAFLKNSLADRTLTDPTRPVKDGKGGRPISILAHKLPQGRNGRRHDPPGLLMVIGIDGVDLDVPRPRDLEDPPVTQYSITRLLDLSCYHIGRADEEILDGVAGGRGCDFDDDVGLSAGGTPEHGVGALAGLETVGFEAIIRADGPAVQHAGRGDDVSRLSFFVGRMSFFFHLHLRSCYSKRSIGAKLAANCYRRATERFCQIEDNRVREDDKK